MVSKSHKKVNRKYGVGAASAAPAGASASPVILVVGIIVIGAIGVGIAAAAGAFKSKQSADKPAAKSVNGTSNTVNTSNASNASNVSNNSSINDNGTAPAPSSTSQPVSGTYNESFNASMLSDTNAFRKTFGSNPLQIDQNLAKQAQAYANWLAKNDQWEHGYIDSSGTRGPSGGGLPELINQAGDWSGVDAMYTGSKAFGQNLSLSWGQNLMSDSAIASFVVSGADGWGGECLNCSPTQSTPCDWKEKTGHFTQQIWKSTTKMGCGKASSSNGKTYVACNYDPPGNNETPGVPGQNLPVSATLKTACDRKYH